jgi:hypothetical protein
MLRTNLPTVPISPHTQWYPSPRTPSEVRPASNLQQTPTSSKLPPPSTIYSIPIPSTAGYNAWWHVVTNAKCQWRLRGGLVCNTCNPSAPYASPYESRSRNQSVCYLTFLSTFRHLLKKILGIRESHWKDTSPGWQSASTKSAYALPEYEVTQHGRTGWVTLLWTTRSAHQRFSNFPWWGIPYSPPFKWFVLPLNTTQTSWKLTPRLLSLKHVQLLTRSRKPSAFTGLER